MTSGINFWDTSVWSFVGTLAILFVTAKLSNLDCHLGQAVTAQALSGHRNDDHVGHITFFYIFAAAYYY